MKSPEVTVTMPSDCEVAIIRHFHAPRRLVFEAWTNPEHVPHWMLGPPGWTMPVCEIDLRVGGSWHFVWRKGDGSEMSMRGAYREVSPPDRLVTTESWGPEWPETVNTLTLTEKDGETAATLTILYSSKEARDAALKTGMKEGMATSYDRLEQHLRTMATT